MSFYQVDCANCSKPVKSAGLKTVCPHCGVIIEMESWQIQHTLTAEGLLVKNGSSKKEK